MSAKLGSLSIVCFQLGLQNLTVVQTVGCPLFRGFLSSEVNGRTVGPFCYIVGVRCRGVSISGVPL